MESLTSRLDANRIRKRNLLRSLKLTARQADAIAKDDIGELTEALNGRKRLFDEIEELDRSYGLLLSERDGSAQSAAGRKSAAEEELETEMRRIVIEAVELDDKNRENAQKMLEKYRAELKSGIKSARRIHSYAGLNQPVDSAYFDSKK